MYTTNKYVIKNQLTGEIPRNLIKVDIYNVRG